MVRPCSLLHGPTAPPPPPPLCMDWPSSLLLRFFRQVVLPYLAGTHCTILTSALVFGGNIFTHPLAIVLLYKQYSWSYHQVHKGGSLLVLGVCQLVGHRLVVPLLLWPQLVMHWLVMHALAKDSPGWPGDVSVTDQPCVHAIYMEDHRRQTTDSCKKLMVSVPKTTPFPFSQLRHRASLSLILAPARTPRIRHTSSKIQDGRRSVRP